jgi:ATP-binding cassette subfamily C protein CydCD
VTALGAGSVARRGPLGALAGLPGLTPAVVHAVAAALAQTAGLVLLAGGLAHAVARAADLADGGIAVALAAAAAGAMVRALATAAGDAAAARDGRRVEEGLRAELVERLAASPAAVTAAGGPAPAALLATTRLHGLGPALATYLPALVQTAVVPPVLLVVLAATDLLSASIVAVTLPLVPVFMVLVGKHTQDGTRDAARALDRIAASVAELVRGLPVLTGLGRAAEQAAALADLGEAARIRTRAVLRLAFLSALVLELLTTLSVALVAVTVGLRLIEGSLALTVGLTALLLAPEAFAPLRALGAAHHAGQDATLAAAEARAVLAAPPGTRAVRTDEDDDPRGARVTVRELTVRYPGRALPALPRTLLDAHPGELVALRGRSGSGKSTLLAVLAGVLPPDAGLDGAVVTAAEVASVPQHPRTTMPTVAAEVARHAGGPDAGALASAALDRVGAAQLADRECTTLSPGELQLVALARALVRVRRGARLLLLDEPTAHLDAEAAARVTAVLAALRGTVTVLLVTHDPAPAALADRTVDLGGGPARASGTGSPSSASVRARTAAADAAPVEGSATVASPRGAIAWPRWGLLRAVATGAGSSLAGIALTAVSGWLIVRAAEMPPVLTLMVAIVGVRAFGLGRAGLRWAERMAAHDAALRLAAETRVRVWRALAAQGLAADRTPGAALSRVVGDIGVLQDLSVRVRPPALAAGGVLLVTAGALAVLDRAAAVAVAAVLAATTALFALALRRLDAGAARRESALRVAELGEVTTVLQGADDLRAHGLAGRVADDLRALAGRRGAAADGGTRAAAVASGLVVAGSGLAAVLGTAVAASGDLTGPAVAALALAPLALTEPLAALVQALRLRGALADARSRLQAVLAAPVPADPASPLPAPAGVRGLALEGVTAGWPGGPDVLRNLGATLEGDGWLVVRGPSGSGKSTLLAVLMAELRPRAGRYALGGVDTARLRGDDVRARTAWLPQEAHVFASTLRGNLALAAPRGVLAGPAGEARMRGALEAAGLGELVRGLPQGLDTAIGAGGTGLSGGERRRLAAARALLADRDVVLLDEPTAHLDRPTAAALVRDLRAALAGRVVVCVTHDDDLAAPGDATVRLDPAAALATA